MGIGEAHLSDFRDCEVAASLKQDVRALAECRRVDFRDCEVAASLKPLGSYCQMLRIAA